MNKNISQRFLTLDIFRGLTVCLMIIVNTQGSLATPYKSLEHAQWNGCTLTDLVFPSFLFAVGNALVFTQKKFAVLKAKDVWFKIIKRTAIIFLIGYLLSWYPFITWNGNGGIMLKPLSETRILSVLQRIALCYFFTAICVYYLSVKSLYFLCGLLLGIYWLILFICGDPSAQYTLEGNAVRKLDLIVLGASHMYKEQGIAFDPEGILSTIPAVVNVIAGYLTCNYIKKKEGSSYAVATIMAAGVLLLLAGICWNNLLPFNKKLWTSSFVVYTVAIDILALAVIFYFVEKRKISYGTYFFTVFGKNALFIYVFSNLIGIFLIFHVNSDTILIDWLNKYIFQEIAPGPFGCLLFSAFFMLVCWLAGYFMDKKKMYIKI